MNKTEIINLLISQSAATSYLEIGVGQGLNFNKINCEFKVGVDSNTAYPATYHQTSDDFFRTNTRKFDIIFIDGLHHADQVERDIVNSVNCLSTSGYIICQNVNPVKEAHQIVPYRGGQWTGDCWKAFVKLRQTRNDINMFTIDSDQGCGIISIGPQDLLQINSELTYQQFDINRRNWLNLVSVETFYQLVTGNSLKPLLDSYIDNPDNPDINFSLGLYYDTIGQTAAAISYYLRSAERSADMLERYECLLRASMCFERQGIRALSVKTLLYHAIAMMPTRPEAYFLLSRFHERENKPEYWFECYLISSIGEQVCDFSPSKLRTNIDYPGKHGVVYEKALSSWWCGLCAESKKLFKDLSANYELDPLYRSLVNAQLTRLNEFNTAPAETGLITYDRSKFDRLKFKFANSELIEKNYSEAYQDMFILSMLNGKKNGTYLEIGAGNTFYGNNTALLETVFDWKGVSLDIDERFVTAFGQERKNPCVLKDATTVNYDRFLTGLDFGNTIDYLQLDCDPPEITYKILLTIPFEKYKFAVITYEHDDYCDDTKSFKEKSRKYLESFGYKLVANNIAPDNWRSYEDWWVHPDLIDPIVLYRMTSVNDTVKKAEEYMLH
jgi:tetratricopeptide (TPR) repeat protein